MKTFVLTVSKTFLKDHPRAGEPTNFKESILAGKKIHTIRKNIEYWTKVLDQVNEGKAILSIREWTGKPYMSKQSEILQLNKANYQLIDIDGWYWKIDGVRTYQRRAVLKIMENDGLTPHDFTNWFPKRFKGIIIHFTENKYEWYGIKKSV